MKGKSDRIMNSKYTTLTGVEEDQRLDVQNSVLCHSLFGWICNPAVVEYKDLQSDRIINKMFVSHYKC